MGPPPSSTQYRRGGELCTKTGPTLQYGHLYFVQEYCINYDEPAKPGSERDQWLPTSTYSGFECHPALQTTRDNKLQLQGRQPPKLAFQERKERSSAKLPRWDKGTDMLGGLVEEAKASKKRNISSRL